MRKVGGERRGEHAGNADRPGLKPCCMAYMVARSHPELPWHRGFCHFCSGMVKNNVDGAKNII